MKLKKSKKTHFFKGGQLFHERFNELDLLDEYPIELREQNITPHKVETEKKKKEKRKWSSPHLVDIEKKHLSRKLSVLYWR
jgi:hypothetical protein